MGGFTHEKPHHGLKDEWLTPKWITDALGPFDLDPCSPINRPWATANRHLTIEDDGLASQWQPSEFVWCNPPYGSQTFTWLQKLCNHPAGGIALIFARTETKGFHETVWDKAHSALFLKGRLKFHHVTGESGESATAPSVLVGYGREATRRLEVSGITGKLVLLQQ
jgi:hypothetical protein